MIQLTKKQILSVHSALISATGGTDGVRDESLLDSALNSPFHTFDGVDLYPSLLQKAARLGYSLISNHPFIDGNKRIGIHTMLIFLEINGVELNYTQNELIELGLKLASDEMKYEDLTKWLKKHN